MFICQPPHPQPRLLDVPDGHRAPVPPQNCSSGSQSDLSNTPLSPASSSSPSSPSIYISPMISEDAAPELHQDLTDSTETCLLSPFSSQTGADPPLPLFMSSSPGPNKSCCFQREPPEGCEKVRVWEETSPSQHLKPVLISSCPDPNKVNFTPHGGSAFCPVSLLKPLLPSMDLLFRSLAVSPAGSCQAAAPDPPPSSTTSSSSAVVGES